MALGALLCVGDESSRKDVKLELSGEMLLMTKFVTLDDVRAAKERIAGVAVRTPLYRVERARLRMADIAEPEFDPQMSANACRSCTLAAARNRLSASVGFAAPGVFSGVCVSALRWHAADTSNRTIASFFTRLRILRSTGR